MPYWTNLIFVPSGLNLAKFIKMLKNTQKLLAGCKFISIILLVFVLNCLLGIGKKVFKWRNYLSQENIQGSKLYVFVAFCIFFRVGALLPIEVDNEKVGVDIEKSGGRQ